MTKITAIIVHCVMPLRLKQMLAYLRDAWLTYKTLPRSGQDVVIVTPGGFADYDEEYAVGDKPVHTGIWLKRQLMALGIPRASIICRPIEFDPRFNTVDSSSEALQAWVMLDRYLPTDQGHRSVDLIIPANRYHGWRIRQTWLAIQRERRGSCLKIGSIQIAEEPNLMGRKWTWLDTIVRRPLWWIDPTCRRWPSRLIIEGRRKATARIDREAAIRRTESGEYDLEAHEFQLFTQTDDLML